MSMRTVGIATLTRDAELTKSTKGAWLKFGIATKRRNVPDGMQDVDFFEANYYIKNPDSPIVGYLKKGQSIYIDNAEIRADMYEKEGQNKVFNKIMIFGFDFVNLKKGEASEKSEDESVEPKKKAIPAAKPVKELPIESELNPSDYDEEIPF